MVLFIILGDFGEAHSFDEMHNATISAVGSMLYMPPEIIKNEMCVVYLYFVLFYLFSHSFPSDVWSLGVILYKVLLCLYFLCSLKLKCS
jgi:serine/threonine protein kinase